MVTCMGRACYGWGGPHSPTPLLALRDSPRQNAPLFFWSPSTVANTKSAEKRARQTIKRRAHNVAARSRLRTAIKRVVAAADAGNKEEAIANLKKAVPIIDTMVNKGIIHRNKAARHKSKLSARVKALVQAENASA